MNRAIHVVCGAWFAFVAGVAGARPVEARSDCIAGTYLVEEGSGTQSLWTLSRDGNFQVASSAQAALQFSQMHGAWKKRGAREARATGLDFNFSTSGGSGGVPPDSVARIDVSLSFSKKCDEVEGSFELRFFDLQSEDPLDPATDTGVPIVDVLMGRRIKAN